VHFSAGLATLQRLPPGENPRFPPWSPAHGLPASVAPHVHGVLFSMREADAKALQKDGYVLWPIEV